MAMSNCTACANLLDYHANQNTNQLIRADSSAVIHIRDRKITNYLDEIEFVDTYFVCETYMPLKHLPQFSA